MQTTDCSDSISRAIQQTFNYRELAFFLADITKPNKQSSFFLSFFCCVGLKPLPLEINSFPDKLNLSTTHRLSE